MNKTKTGESIPSLKVAEVILVQCSILDTDFQQKSEVLYTFMSKKSDPYLLNVEPSNLLFSKNQ